MTQSAPGLEVIEQTTPQTSNDDGDHERFAHWVFPASAVTEALVTGTPVVALCGKVWVPGRDPGRFPVCPTCKEILGQLPPGDDGDDSKGSDG